MPRYWPQFGRPKDTPSINPPVIQTYESSFNLSLASLKWRNGHVDCGFADDTLWYKAGRPHRAGEGVAVVKLSFRLHHRVMRSLSRVECHVTFSQAPGKRFHSVHRCWPSVLRGSLNTEQVSRALDFTPAVDVMGIGASLGGVHLNTERTNQSNWVFTSQSRVSDPPTGGRYDTVVLGWEALGRNDYVSFSGRDLYTATVLSCAEGDLILNTRLAVKRTHNEPQMRVSRTSKKVATASVQITMRAAASDDDLGTHVREAMSWADDRNREAIPIGNLENRTDSTNVY
jgi:hypothetical protein